MKVLFIGLGGIGQRHLRNIKALLGDAVEIYAIRKRKAQFVLDNKLNIQENLNLDELYNINHCNSIEEAYKIGIDTVFITNPTSMHMENLLKAAEYSWNIFVEKPISHNLENIEALQNILRKNNNISFVGYQNRFHPCIKQTKKLLEEKSIGRVISVSSEIGEDVTKWHKYEDYRNMYASREDLGGGVVLSQIHELDYINWFFGKPKNVYAVGGKLSELEIDVEDISSAIFNYKVDGYNIPVHIHQDYIQNPPSRKCKIIGTEGKLEIDLLSATICQYDKFGEEILNITYDFERNDMFVEELSDFLNAIEKEKNIGITIDEGIESLKMALAIKDSMKTGKIVNID